MRNRFRIAICCACVAALSPAFAHGAEEQSAENRIGRDDWSSQMADALPGALCKDGSYFRECFAATQGECGESMKAVTRACLDKFKGEMPEMLTQPADGETWSGKIGECVGAEYESKNAAKRVKTAKCDDPTKW